MGEYLALAMFPALLLALFLGFPVAFSMMGVALFFGLVTFGDAVIFQFVQKVDAVGSNFVLAAVPLFIFMGAMMERSGNERAVQAILGHADVRSTRRYVELSDQAKVEVLLGPGRGRRDDSW